MASVVQNKRTSESKFVSICADGSEGTPDVDISFREPLLSRPSDHYMVGVDNLTINMNHLSMMRQSTGIEDFVFRIGRFSNLQRWCTNSSAAACCRGRGVMGGYCRRAP